ncbi:MAG: diguanylate cyclase [Acidobacteria bacterium]|nr:diguanylate cyclase [Acidobacteriota bacterium]
MSYQMMDEQQAAHEREVEQVQPQDAPANWTDAQNSLAAAAGLSILLVEGHQPPALAVSNNNSICHAFQTSSRHAHLCEPYCGEAFLRAMQAGEAAHYRCHAGLHCFAMPVELDEKRKLAIIGGRAFLTTADYRALAERIRVGDLQDMLTGELFSNVIFAARQDLHDLAKRISASTVEYRNQAAGTAAPKKTRAAAASASAKESKETVAASPAKGRAAAASSLQEKLPAVGVPIDEACRKAVRAVAEKYNLESLALLLRSKDAFGAALATGRFASQQINLSVEAHDARLLEASRRGASVLMTETPAGFETAASVGGFKLAAGKKAIELFPLVIEDEVKGALLIADAALDIEKRQALSSFCRELALPLEVLRLKDELNRRARFAASLQTFTTGINVSDPAETYSSILKHSAELLRAERSSLLVYDEASNELAVKAAFGPRAKVAATERVRLGDGISGTVMMNGRPLVVRDLEAAGREPAPAERLYKTKSFISYPISIGGRKVGVLNLTDKTDGSAYDEMDLGLIETLAPQMALALDRAEWQEKAAQFQLMSITDPLTGLLNRRYLEERLAEELRRSERQNYAMSFVMIDIDDFKFYNDQNGHPAGDLALEMTAQCLKSVLRAADVASRYGGEEFCILLPQTKLDEATAIAERIRRRVERTRFPHGKTQPLGMVTVSIGVSALDENLNTPAAIIGAADRALYLAKRTGKNRVQVLNDPTDSRTTDADERAPHN